MRVCRLWVLGFGFVAFGSVFDLVALGFAAQSVVATVRAARRAVHALLHDAVRETRWWAWPRRWVR
jgi:hypothetical protein